MGARGGHAEPVLKLVPDDFVVREIPLVGETLGDPGTEHHDYAELMLTKCGLTTFEALTLVADGLRMPRSEIAYAGLKDEDGVTIQLLTVPATAGPAGSSGPLTASPVRERFEWRDGGRWLSVRGVGPARESKQVGELFGNAFRVVARRLAWPAEAPGELRFTVPVLNYYDTQRFGVPGGPLLSDLIGERLLAGADAEAFDLVRRSGVPEAAAAQDHAGPAAEFFGGLDQRVVAFWHSAYYSRRWNEELGALLAGALETEVILRRGREYVMPTAAHARAVLGAVPLEVPCDTARATPDGITVLRRPRATGLLTTFRMSAPEPDELHPGCARVTLQFMLPSGAYATFAVYQALRLTGLVDIHSSEGAPS